jgi:hypothetical protein
MPRVARAAGLDKAASRFCGAFLITTVLAALIAGSDGSAAQRMPDESAVAVSPSQPVHAPRALSAAELRSEIALHGAKAVVHRLWHIPPERGDEGWMALEEQVATGSDEWLQIAEQLAAVTDAGASHGLEIALHHAQTPNPKGVLSMLPHLPFSVESICANGDDEAEVRELMAAQSSVGRVSAPELRPQRDRCLTALAEAVSAVR